MPELSEVGPALTHFRENRRLTRFLVGLPSAETLQVFRQKRKRRPVFMQR